MKRWFRQSACFCLTERGTCGKKSTVVLEKKTENGERTIDGAGKILQ
ncbi:MAG: hypothetical protein LUH14_12990 [Clostridiaceae bacterium]|nr:hypothetical protein [Clostridiaceae bacterium]